MDARAEESNVEVCVCAGLSGGGVCAIARERARTEGARDCCRVAVELAWSLHAEAPSCLYGGCDCAWLRVSGHDC